MSQRLCSVCGAVVGILPIYPKMMSISPSVLEWCNYFRALTESGSETSGFSYKLSGTSFHEMDMCRSTDYDVPIDPNTSVDRSQVEQHEKKQRRRVKYHNLPVPGCVRYGCACQFMSPCHGLSYPDVQHCFSVHAHCWKLVQRIIGPLVEKNLNSLVAAMRGSWKAGFPDDYGLHDVVDIYKDDCYQWIGHRLVSTPSPRVGPDLILSYKARVTPLTDPFNVPALGKLIRRSRKRTTGGVRRLTRANRSLRTASKASDATPMGLPLDIRQLILDELPEPVDAVNAALAFQWRLPDAYWRRRLPLGMLFELDGIASDELDWQYLFAEYEYLSKSSRALSNRKRIFTILGGIRDRFFDIVNSCDQHGTENRI